jgi:hypothetical protein
VVVSILPCFPPPLPFSCIGVQKMKIFFPPPTPPPLWKKVGSFRVHVEHLIG